MNENTETAIEVVDQTAIVPAGVPGLTVASLAEAEKMAEKLAASSLVPDHFQGKPSDCFMAIAFGVELGLPPVTALASIAVVKGKPTLYAATMVALVMASGKARSFNHVSSSATEATYETVRHGQKIRQYTFTMAEATAAGLTFDGQNSKSMYSKYAKQMLEARAKSFLCRDVYPDVLHGLEGYEEVRDREPSDIPVEKFDEPASAIDVPSKETNQAPSKQEVKPEAKEEPGWSERILATKTREALASLRPLLAKLTGQERKKALKLYADQDKVLKKSEAE